MTDQNLTPEQWELVWACLSAIANSDPEGPSESEYQQYLVLLDMGFTPQWIAANM